MPRNEEYGFAGVGSPVEWTESPDLPDRLTVLKGELVKHHLMSRFLERQYTFATPVPDSGEDLWICRGASYGIERIQLKSMHSLENPNTQKKKNYSFKQNITVPWYNRYRDCASMNLLLAANIGAIDLWQGKSDFKEHFESEYAYVRVPMKELSNFIGADYSVAVKALGKNTTVNTIAFRLHFFADCSAEIRLSNKRRLAVVASGNGALLF